MLRKQALGLLLVIIASVIVFQALVIAKAVPRDIVAGGRLTSDSQMYLVAGGAIVMSVLFAWLLMQRGGLVSHRLPASS